MLQLETSRCELADKTCGPAHEMIVNEIQNVKEALTRGESTFATILYEIREVREAQTVIVKCLQGPSIESPDAGIVMRVKDLERNVGVLQKDKKDLQDVAKSILIKVASIVFATLGILTASLYGIYRFSPKP